MPFRIRYLLNRPEDLAAMGRKAQRFVRENCSRDICAST
jgi:hypothetical protein